jgi:repressor of nif and glnA expression
MGISERQGNGMADRKRGKMVAVLKLLAESRLPLTSADIAEMLAARGQDVSERAVRLYLLDMDQQGLSVSLGRRRGRTLTEKGRAELQAGQALERVGLLSARIDTMTYGMTFDLHRRSGGVVVNVSLADRHMLSKLIDEVCSVFAKGYAMGHMVSLLGPGEGIGTLVVPDGMVGFCTVCSVTVNGVLLKHGIPTHSRFGGLIELRHGQALRFVELIHYDGTSIDPLEVFIRSGMTDYRGAVDSGCGRIGASFRELPAQSRDMVQSLCDNMADIGLGALLTLGMPGQPVMDVPVSDGRIGAVIVGGLNPIAILAEYGCRVQPRAMCGLMEYTQLFRYSELPERLRRLNA